MQLRVAYTAEGRRAKQAREKLRAAGLRAAILDNPTLGVAQESDLTMRCRLAVPAKEHARSRGLRPCCVLVLQGVVAFRARGTEEAMHVRIVRFHLEEMTEAEYARACDETAQAFAAAPGLDSEVWLADANTGTFGGVCFWRDRASMESYAKSDLYDAVVRRPNLADISSIDFAVMEALSRVTRGQAAAK